MFETVLALLGGLYYDDPGAPTASSRAGAGLSEVEMGNTVVSGPSESTDPCPDTPPDKSTLDSHPRGPLRTWGPLAGIIPVFVALAVWSWRKWPDALIDFGMQLYVPWQLASGKILYRDLAYLSAGPLSQHLHALAFALFGPSFTVLIVLNLCILLLFLVLLYRLFLSAADLWTAMTVCLVTLIVFSFSQYVRIGNYNYVCPYLYETFHGLVLSALAIVCLDRWLHRRHHGWAVAAGVCSGGVFLAKPEIYVALLAAVGTVAFVSSAGSLVRFKGGAKAVGWFLVGHALPLVATLVYYAFRWSWQGGLQADIGAWRPLLATSLPRNVYYQWCLGLDQPSQNLILMFRSVVGFCLITAALAACSWRPARRSFAVSGVLALPFLVLVYFGITSFRWEHSGRPLVPLTLLGSGFLAHQWWRLRHSAAGKILTLPLIWSVFALVLLAKMGLNTRIWHYGFYLAMPATVFVVFCLLWIVPRQLSALRVSVLTFRMLVTILLIIGGFRLLARSNIFYAAKDSAIGLGGDRILGYNPRLLPEGDAVRQAVNWLRMHTPSTTTLAVLPEGTQINYLARRVNPTRFPVLPAPEFIAHTEDVVLAEYIRHSPDAIVLVHRDSSDFGVGYFGKDPAYGQRMMQWIRANYSPVWQYGAEPFETGQFGMQILVRRVR